MSSEEAHGPVWNKLSKDPHVLDELQSVMETAWFFIILYQYVDIEIVGIMKCTERLVHLFLSDPSNEDIHDMGYKKSIAILAIRSLKISWSLLSQNENEDFSASYIDFSKTFRYSNWD